MPIDRLDERRSTYLASSAAIGSLKQRSTKRERHIYTARHCTIAIGNLLTTCGYIELCSWRLFFSGGL